MYLFRKELTFNIDEWFIDEQQDLINKERKEGWTLTNRTCTIRGELTKVYYEISLTFERP